jgi:hypothetical protein
VFDGNVTAFQKIFKDAERVLLVILRLYLQRRPVMKRYGTPAERFYILHGVAEEVFIGHAFGKVGDSEIPLLSPGNAVDELDAALSDQVFQNCKGPVHNFT